MGRDVAVRSVVFDYRSLEHVRTSADQKGLDAPVMLGNPDLREILRVEAFPTFYVLSRDGDVPYSTQGCTTTVGLLARAWW